MLEYLFRWPPASSELFLHLYGEALPACPGATAGSCYGKWIVANRKWRGLPTEPLANHLTDE